MRLTQKNIFSQSLLSRERGYLHTPSSLFLGCWFIFYLCGALLVGGEIHPFLGLKAEPVARVALSLKTQKGHWKWNPIWSALIPCCLWNM